MTGIYIHIPFCRRKCPYCDFYSAPADDETIQRYVEAVCRNISYYGGQGIEADTIYFGGGTPSLLSVGQLDSIISACDRNFNLVFPEITLEANPSSVDYRKLAGYRRAGVNRISFGVQSAVDSELEFLGRLHNFEQAEYAVENAVEAGFDNISCDLMIGLAGQTMKSLAYSVNKLLVLPLYHISAYMLKIEKGTAFDCEKVKKQIADEDLVCDMYLETAEMLEKKGFEHYEVSNFAKNRAYSRHNLKYWRGEEYLGFGAGAHSFFAGKRYCCPKDTKSYIAEDKQQETLLEVNPDKLEEYIMLGLRLKWGIELQRVSVLGGRDFAKSLLSKALLYSENDLCIIENGRVSLTAKGFLVSNDIISEFLDC